MQDLTPRGARAAVFVVFVAHGSLFGTWFARIPAIRADLGLSEGEIGTALFGSTVGVLASLPVAGWIVARQGSRTTVALGLPVAAALLPTLALAPGLPSLVAALLVFGMTAGAVDVAMNAHGIAVERCYERPIFSTFHAGWSLGALLGAAAAAPVAAAEVGALPHFAAVGVALAVAGLVASRALLPASADRLDEPTGFVRPPRRLLPLAALAFAVLFAESAAESWSALYVDGPLGAGAGVAALAYAAFSVAMTVFRLLGDPLTARIGPVALTQLGGIVAAAGLALALLGGRPALALVGFALMGSGLAAVVPIAFRAAGSLPGIPPGAGIAALTSVGYSAFLIGPPAIGFLAEAIGLGNALWSVVLLLAVIVALAPTTRPASPG